MVNCVKGFKFHGRQIFIKRRRRIVRLRTVPYLWGQTQVQILPVGIFIFGCVAQSGEIDQILAAGSTPAASGIHQECETMIKTKIEFDCTWSKVEVQKLFDKLINAAGITELGLSMIFMPIEPIAIKEPEPDRVPAPKPPYDKSKLLKQIDCPWPVTAKTPEPEPAERPMTFSEINRIPDADLGPRTHTLKPILTYAETKDGRVAIYYNESPTYTTMETVRALPTHIHSDLVQDLSNGKRAALRGFKKFITDRDAADKALKGCSKHMTDIDPYAPILTGGAKVDTRVSGKVEGDLK